MNYPTYLTGGNKIEIGDGFQCMFRNRINALGASSDNRTRIKIGDNVSMQNDCHIGAINYIEIGNNCMLASKIFIADHNHGHICAEELDTPVNLRDVVSPGPVIIGKNVWIGEAVAILPNVKIGDYAIIGANSVVTHDIPANCVAVGNPARIIKKLR